MRAFVIGSKKLSVSILRTLLNHGFEVVGVYSRDDDSGMKVWHNELGHPSLKAEAEQSNIPVFEGMKVNSEESLAILESLNIDVIFSCFWSELFKEPILNIPRLGVFNFHTAYLPKNRGSRPGPWAIIKGEEHSGITLHKMLTGVDNGPVVDSEKVDISPGETGLSLYDKVQEAGERLLAKTLPSFLDGNHTLTLQTEADATYQLRGEPFGGQVNRYWPEAQTDRFRRAMFFPPFRGHRNSPKATKIPDVAVCAITLSEAEITAISIPQSKDLETRLHGGNALQRKLLRRFIPEVKNGIASLDQQLNLEAHLPLLEALRNRGFQAIVTEGNADLQDVLQTQPHRYHNGILKLPFRGLPATNLEVEKDMILADKLSEAHQAPIYILYHINTDQQQALERIAEVAGARMLSIDEVCVEFNTVYEDISA